MLKWYCLKEFRAYLIREFKYQFLIFLGIRVGEKVCENKCNVI